MPHYLLQVAYTPEAWAMMSKNPQNRLEAVRPAVNDAMQRTSHSSYEPPG